MSIYPELLGNIFPFDSGPVLMTPGRLPLYGSMKVEHEFDKKKGT